MSERPRRDRRTGSSRSLASALEGVRAEVAPLTLLASVQEAWPEAAGRAIAREGDPVSERDGVVTVSCRSATWAQELDLIKPVLVEKLSERLEGGPFEGALEDLRFTADAARHDPV